MLHFAARVHALAHGLFRPSDRQVTLALYDEVAALRTRHGIASDKGYSAFVVRVAHAAAACLDRRPADQDLTGLAIVLDRVLAYENMFAVPEIDWSEPHSVSEYWTLRDALRVVRDRLKRFDAIEDELVATLVACADAIQRSLPSVAGTSGAILVPTQKVHAIARLGKVVEAVCRAVDALDDPDAALLPRHVRHLRRNLVLASGGNPDDPRGLSRPPKLPSKTEIRDPNVLIETYLAGTPLAKLFDGDVEVAIPTVSRFEHHHIVAGSGHGKTQTLQYLIGEDLAAVARGERSVVVLDSQGDLIRTISGLKQFAPGEPLHERVVIIDPTDVEYPVSLNLFDVGLERLDRYSPLDRERLTNSILELYDFVLGSLLAAEMTQKQSVIFRYVTRLMLHIPDATIHTLRDLMEPKSEVRFAPHIAKLTGTARQFFETEFPSKEFEQRRRWRRGLGRSIGCRATPDCPS